MKNMLIKASAGTGKTFALATRMIRLMLLGTDPRHIVALTFSRAAAGEIFSRVAERLAAAATDAPGAAAETAHVLNGLPPPLADALQAAHPGGLSATVFAGLLRNLIATQHVSMIGTIDSFMTRMVQAFPLELGLQGTLAIMDDYHASREKHAAAAALLNATADAGAFCEAFQLATAGREGKSFCAKLDDFIDAWHTAYLNHPDTAAWGDPETIFGRAGFLPRNEKPNAVECHRVPSNAIEDGNPASLASRLRDTLRADWETAGRVATWDEFCDFVHAFNGTFSDKAAVRNVLAACTPVGDITISYNRRKVTFTAEKAALIREAVGTLLGTALKIRCDRTQGIHRLMTLIESVYAANTRRHGKLVFDDIPRLIARLDDATRQNIEYRFDTRFRHWALDEFQDTSHAQWNAIRNLVEEVIQSTDERSMFIVGDMKQAIYGWRGGDVAIFEREAASGLYEQLALNDSYRYAPEIADCVNRIFDGGRIAAFLTGRAEAAGAKWQRLWAPHRSAAKRNGHVSVRRVPAPDKDAGERDIDPYLNAAREELARIRPWERGISAAVLVRTNTQGAQFAEALRAAHIPAVWEGESAISDTPVVTALLNLLRFAEHPGDTLAWQHIRATPLAARVFPDIFARPPNTNFFTQSHSATEGYREPLKENIPVLCASVSLCEKSGHCEAQHALSKRVLADVSRHGLPRALRGYTEAMGPTDPFTQSRLDMLLRAAVQFTAEADAEATLTDFADYVARFTTRDVADTSTVKIITVHRSKGLGFDHVILPLIEPKGITSLRADDILGAPDGTWLLTRPP
ncbi:MAG: UvrD-helicase domain-containing protein, partial [Kiritimatiellaeota bacterium]|nr:UvrD-helicase domain-containing protein [Kiritimatiellota bacterium]